MSRRRLWKGLVQDLWANGVVASPLVPYPAKFLLLRLLPGFHLERANIHHGVRWWGSGRVVLGARAFINRYCTINHSAEVRIGRNATLGPEVLLITASHDVGDAAKRSGRDYSAPIRIGEGAWLGARVTVLPGVAIGEGAVIAAGALVRSDVPPHELWGGVPARRIRTLSPEQTPAAG
ncbi:DapH/DapD/GlmU-related protein [Naasia sp. SYSU D00948]|uniref:acyltransferase n=1 Tax=Naasia sp. SYSU D00948 TaxID=2817379 RepID=UPI001B3162A5|nr:acyltransferase [Naasia sp. SYSU D00948]